MEMVSIFFDTICNWSDWLYLALQLPQKRSTEKSFQRFKRSNVLL